MILRAFCLSVRFRTNRVVTPNCFAIVSGSGSRLGVRGVCVTSGILLRCSLRDRYVYLANGTSFMMSVSNEGPASAPAFCQGDRAHLSYRRYARLEAHEVCFIANVVKTQVTVA